jgi:lysophospholipase L1-like esterase
MLRNLIYTTAFIFLSLCTMHKKTRIVFFGDSLTELAIKPRGFITRIDSISKIEKPGKYEFSGSGISANKVYDLYLRLEQDVLSIDPDVVVIIIGVNDVWHKRLLGTGTDPDKFEKFYQAIIDKLKAKAIKTILCTPAVIGEKKDLSNELDGDLDRYCNIIRDLARLNGLTLVDLRKSFLEYNLENNAANKESGILTYDRVHLNDRGNQLVAEELWKAISKEKE